MHRLLVPALALSALLFVDPVLAQDSPPSGRLLSSPEEQRQADEAMNTPSGRAGRDEPGVHAPTSNAPLVLKDGKLTVPSAPSQSQTTPDAPQGTIGKSQ
jgi:hypothetical protein